MLPPRELHMSASIIPPLPDPPSPPSTSTSSVSLPSRSFLSPLTAGGRGGPSSRFSATGGWFQPPPPPPRPLSDSVVQRVSIPLSIFPVFFSRPPSRTSIESFLPAEPTGHTARLFSSHLLCKRTQSRPVTLSLLLLLLLSLLR